MYYILVINAGSTSVKYQLFDMDTKSVMMKGGAERIGSPNATLKQKCDGKGDYAFEGPLLSHHDAVVKMLELLVDPVYGPLKDIQELHAIGHRVSHGADDLREAMIITDHVKDMIRNIFELAPIHNPPQLAVIEETQALLPELPMVVMCDTSYHKDMPPKAFLFAIPYECYTDFRVRRYGFHGISHQFVCERASEMLGKPLSELRIISCHLGGGSSITALDRGKSLDNTMGFTPMEGVPMATRCGDLDAAAPEFLMKKYHKSAAEITELLNKKSGLLGLSGISSDLRDIHAAIAEGNERAKLTIEVLGYRVKKYIGAYAAALGGVDCVIFTGGIGENDEVVRALSLEGLAFMGLRLDKDANEKGKGTRFISAADSPVPILVIPTNEELVIAENTYRLIHG